MPGSRLSVAERELIMLAVGEEKRPSWTEIGERLGRHRSTIQREVARNGGSEVYSAHVAQQRARVQACRRSTKFERDPGLAQRVRERLVRGESPYSISVALNRRVWPETIYQGIYRGVLRVDPTEALRTRRHHRKHRHLRQRRNDGNFLGSFTSIHLRPAEINDRLEVGHWEGDLVTGAKNQSAFVTLIERVTRYVVALNLPSGHSATATIERLSRWIESHPFKIRSITWDRGGEMAYWQRLTTSYGIPVFFCDPQSPWQRGSNEHANGLLRWWFPKGTNLNTYTQTDLNNATHTINHLHRRILNNQTAHHLYHHQPRNKE